MATTTRDRLIDAARQLFIRNGVENTTIGDIANASDKGRRTIYTYFKNKKEIYRAVIEQESEKRVKTLRELCASDMSAVCKLRNFFEIRFSQTKLESTSYPLLRNLLSSDFRRSEQIRKLAYQKEEKLLFGILDEGIASGEFDPARCMLMRNFLYRLFHAIDTLSTHDEFTPVEAGNSTAFVDFLVKGVQK